MTSAIVGTWKKSVTDSYYGVTTTYTLRLNADNTGSMTFAEGSNSDVYNLVYTFDATTNTGTAVMSYASYGGSYRYSFRVEWFGSDNINLYIRYEESGYTAEWENVGVFTRQ